MYTPRIVFFYKLLLLYYKQTDLIACVCCFIIYIEVIKMEHLESRDRYLLSSVNHTLKVLDLLSVRDNLGVTEIGRLTGFDKASVFKMLYTLEHRGYVVKTESAKYRLGEKLTIHGSQLAKRQNVVDVSAPIMRRLCQECRQSVYLGVLNTNGKVIFMHKEEGEAPGHITARVAYEIDAHTNATGKLLIANLEPDMQKSVLAKLQLRPHTDTTITDPQAFQRLIERLRGAKCAETYGENYPRHGDIAALICDNTGHCIAAVSIVCPLTALQSNLERFRQLVSYAARRISRDMGYWET